MKRVAILCTLLAVTSFGFAHNGGLTQSQSPPASQGSQPNAAGTQAPATQAPGTQAAPAAKRPPQAKTQPEFDAFKTASAITDPAALEKAADDFAAKYPDSELRIILYKTAMRAYQNANNGDKMLEMARKTTTIDPDDPEALVDIGEVLTERTHDTDLDKDQRLDEAKKAIERALTTIDTDIPAGVPADKLDAYKGLLRSTALSVLGTLQFNKNDFASAEGSFRKSIDAYPTQPDPVTVLRLSLALDRQNKYPEALTYANKAVEMTQDGTGAGQLARRERDRLQQLTGTAGKPAAPASGATMPATNAGAPPKP
jgi:tetratricopeptide (TPR) repeat protein